MSVFTTQMRQCVGFINVLESKTNPGVGCILLPYPRFKWGLIEHHFNDFLPFSYCLALFQTKLTKKIMGQQQPTGVPAVGDAYDRTSVTLTYECLRPVNVGSSPG